MKKYIHLESDARLRYQAARAGHTKERARKDYVLSIYHSVCDYLDERINRELFEPNLDEAMIDRFIDTYNARYADVMDEPLTRDNIEIGFGKRLQTCNLVSTADCMKVQVYVYGRCGLVWLADLLSGGDGIGTYKKLSYLPAATRRKLAEFQNQIATFIEDAGLEVLGPAKYNQDGEFWYPVTDAEYEKLI